MQFLRTHPANKGEVKKSTGEVEIKKMKTPDSKGRGKAIKHI